MRAYYCRVLLCLVIFAAGLTGCKGKKQPVQADNNANEPNATVKKVEQRLVVATVDGINIFKDDFEARVEQQIGKVQRQMPANFFEQYKKELGKKVLDEMIVDIILAKKAKQQGIVVTEEEMNDRVNEIVQRQKMSMKDFREMLAAKGEDFGKFTEQVRQNLQFEKLVAAETGPINVSDEEANAFFTANSGQFTKPGQAVSDNNQADKPAFEQVKGEVIKVLTENKRKELAGQYIQKLKKEANIVYSNVNF